MYALAIDCFADPCDGSPIHGLAILLIRGLIYSRGDELIGSLIDASGDSRLSRLWGDSRSDSFADSIPDSMSKSFIGSLIDLLTHQRLNHRADESMSQSTNVSVE